MGKGDLGDFVSKNGVVILGGAAVFLLARSGFFKKASEGLGDIVGGASGVVQGAATGVQGLGYGISEAAQGLGSGIYQIGSAAGRIGYDIGELFYQGVQIPITAGQRGREAMSELGGTVVDITKGVREIVKTPFAIIQGAKQRFGEVFLPSAQVAQQRRDRAKQFFGGFIQAEKSFFSAINPFKKKKSKQSSRGRQFDFSLKPKAGKKVFRQGVIRLN